MCEHVADQIAPRLLVIPARGVKLLRGDRRYVRKGVDLAMRVRERHPDFSSLILKDEDILHEVVGAQRLKPVCPDVDQFFDLSQRQFCQLRVKLRRITDYLANSLGGQYWH